jgi:hypothetical protein
MDNRRNFLKGILGGVTATGLIIAAKPEEIAAFSRPLAKDAELVIDIPAPSPATNIGERLYNERGELVAMVTDLSIHRDAHPYASEYGYTEYAPGPLRIEIRAIGVGTLVWEGKSNHPELRGR